MPFSPSINCTLTQYLAYKTNKQTSTNVGVGLFYYYILLLHYFLIILTNSHQYPRSTHLYYFSNSSSLNLLDQSTMSSTHHAKTDSEVTSLAPSSPNRPVYYVQSPSRDSHDGEKTTNSFHSTPILSPMGSPGRQSRDSSSTRYSGSLKPGSQKSSNGSRSNSGRHHNHRHRKGDKQQWKEFDAIEEEGLLDDDAYSKSVPRRCYFLAFIVGFFLLFTFFSLILWGASRNQKPVVTMKSISYNEFGVQSGMDFSGVATVMVSMNSTVKLIFGNTGTFFGVHVTSTPLVLSFSQLTVATGTIKKFYQGRKSQRTVTVSLIGNKIPLYGGGVDLMSKEGKPLAPVSLTLDFKVRARAYVLGRLVKPKFYKRVQCNVVMEPKKMNVPISLKKFCTYI